MRNAGRKNTQYQAALLKLRDPERKMEKKQTRRKESENLLHLPAPTACRKEKKGREKIAAFSDQGYDLDVWKHDD